MPQLPLFGHLGKKNEKTFSPPTTTRFWHTPSGWPLLVHVGILAIIAQESPCAA
jgi:hypothetical protein